MHRLAAVLTVAALTVGCGGDAFSPSGVSGTYALVSVNGVTLPATVTFGGETLTFISGSLTLREDQTWLFSGTASSTEGATTVTETETQSGTFTLVEPSTIRFTDTDGGEEGPRTNLTATPPLPDRHGVTSCYPVFVLN